MSIVVFGSINIDLTTYGEALPQPGQTLHADRYAIGLGGKGCNQAVAAGKLTPSTYMVGRVGTDSFGDLAVREMEALGLSCDHVYPDPQNNTGIAVIGVDANAENCITVVGGANMAIDPSDVERAKLVFESADILLLQMEIPLEAALLAADMVRANGGMVVLDPAPAPKSGFDETVLRRVDVITPNETETEILTGVRPTNAQEAKTAAGLLRKRGVDIAVVKLGSKGVFYQSASDEGFVDAFKVNSIDTVAAGDCFNGGLAHSLAQGSAIGDAVRFAAACGALSTTKRGASGSAPRLDEVERLLSA